MKIDNKKYFELLNEAANNPDCVGVYVSKRRYIGVEAANMEYASTILKKGERVSLGVKEENQEYIDRWVGMMKNYYGLNVEYRKLYSVRFMEEGIFEDKDKFIGYELFCPTENKTAAKGSR